MPVSDTDTEIVDKLVLLLHQSVLALQHNIQSHLKTMDGIDATYSNEVQQILKV